MYIFQANKKDDQDKAQYAREFIQALLKLTDSDVNAVVGPKNMPDEPEEHYAPEGRLLASSDVIFLLNFTKLILFFANLECFYVKCIKTRKSLLAPLRDEELLR